MTVVLVVLVVACCVVFMWHTTEQRRQYRDLHAQTMSLVVGWHEKVIETEIMRLQNDARATELQAALSQAELQARTQERVTALQQPPVPTDDGPVNAWFAGAPHVFVDEDPNHLDPLPDLTPQFPTFGEQQDGGFAVPPDQQYGAMVPPGTSLIPGAENEARAEDVH